MPHFITQLAAACLAAATGSSIRAQDPDPRLKEVSYDPHAVVTVAVKRGVVTHVSLDGQEAITEVGTGVASDCTKPDASWCIAAQAGGHNIFVKPKTTATVPNNVAVVTDKRSHAFRFVVLPDADPHQPVYRLIVKAPLLRVARPAVSAQTHPSAEPQSLDTALPEDVIAERLLAAPHVLNGDYSVAEGGRSKEIVPTLVFDDGRFTYLRFPNNSELPAVFHVLDDGSETVVNTRMEGDLLVVDRVSRRLMLRSGSAVVSLWNLAFDPDGVATSGGTTVHGLHRVLRGQSAAGRGQPLPGATP